MNKKLREGVTGLAEESVSSIKDAILGKVAMTDRIRNAIRVISLGVKVEHMDQLSEQSNRSFALRIVPFLPKDVDRDAYIRATNPQVAPLMLPRPKL